MRIGRARLPSGRVAYGLIEEGQFLSTSCSPFEKDWSRALPDHDALSLSSVQLLAPCCPSKIVAVGRNYAAHAAEHGAAVPREPLIFLKPPSAVIGPGAAIVLPSLSKQVEHEAELAVVIGHQAKDLRPESALQAVLGYTCANDVTARDLQRSDGQWSRAKGFDTFCPLGPWIETDLDPTALTVTCSVGDTLRQEATTADMVFGIPFLLAYVSRVMTLQPGDVLLTGTPEGVGALSSGDTVTISISGIGSLLNTVTEAASNKMISCSH